VNVIHVTSDLTVMTGAVVPIATVAVDPPYTKSPGRIRYRVTLACGCFWWEDHAEDAPAPVVGKTLSCFHPHLQRPTTDVAKPSLVALHSALTGPGIPAVARVATPPSVSAGAEK
jgi:hypothetical protein